MNALAKKTAPSLSYGPYANAAEATICIQRFIDEGFSPDMARGLGIIWAEPNGSAVLRPPLMMDQEDQIGSSLLVQWHGAVAPTQPKLPAGTVWQSIEDAVRGVYEKIGAGIHAASRSLDKTQQMMRQSFGDNPTPEQMDAEGGVYALMELREAWRWAERELATHPKTAAVASTVLDAVGVVAGIVGIFALLPEALTVAGAAALVGAVTATGAAGALIRADGKDAYLLLEGDKAAADEWEHSDYYRRTELIAPLLALPDAVRGGVGVAREIGEASDEVRGARAGVAQAAAKTDLAAAKVADQEAANAAKAKIYKGDRQKLQKLVVSQKNAVKRLRKANKILEEARDALRKALIKSSWPDMPALLSAAGGTGVYVGNLPDLTHKSSEAAEKRAAKYTQTTPAQKLVPQRMTGFNATHYLSCGIVVSSPLQNPGQK